MPYFPIRHPVSFSLICFQSYLMHLKKRCTEMKKRQIALRFEPLTFGFENDYIVIFTFSE
jgi:hypothetical protein